MLKIYALALIAVLSAQAQNFDEIAIEKAVAGMKFTEGAVWSHEGFLLFSDVPNNKIMKLTPGEGVSVFRDESNGTTGNAFDDKGRLYSCESRLRRVTRTDKKGKIEVLADKWQGKKLNAPNDIVVSKRGDVYFTDPAFAEQLDHRELDFFGVYHISSKGEMELVAKPAGRPNGIAFSPSGKILYVGNSDERNVRAYDIGKDGSAGNERVFVSNIDGVPDGIKVDEKGNLYVAAKGLIIYSPEGKLIHTIPLGEAPSNCAFGDADLKTLYITARTSVYRIRLDVKGAVQY
jgi:gluconolactonase